MDLRSRFIGLELSNPLVPSASPMTRDLDACRQLEDAGAGALVMHSLFEESVTQEEQMLMHYLHHDEPMFAEAHGEGESSGPSALDAYLGQIHRLKGALSIPIIASLNGITPSGWLGCARDIEQAGADGIELNCYFLPADVGLAGVEVEARYLELLIELRQQVNIPINMKLSPWFSALANMIGRVSMAGAEGVTLFNRFYQPDINIERMRLQPSLHPSHQAELLLAMRWIAIMHGRTPLSLGGSGGVHTAEDAIKLLLAGADVVHLCSALLQDGPNLVARMTAEIGAWMETRGFSSLAQWRGRLSQSQVPDPTEFERAHYFQIIDSYSFDAE